jgi:hypothetical protein
MINIGEINVDHCQPCKTGIATIAMPIQFPTKQQLAGQLMRSFLLYSWLMIADFLSAKNI